ALDSMSLYRGMDIGTAKPDAAQRALAPHHLIDILEPHQEFSLVDYVQAAGWIAREILERGRVPLFVGGTGLYLRGVLRGVFAGLAAGLSRVEMTELIQARTRQFANRQHTWFRNLIECTAVEITGAESPREIAKLVRNQGQELSRE